MASNSYFYAIGRRKSATAQVRLKSGSGNIVINDQPASEYLQASKYLIKKINEPFSALDQENKYDISIRVKGGGATGQADAMRLAIAKALTVLNEDYKSTLKRANLLGRDSREKERKKFGLKGARKQRQFTKR